jgi:hypothetical protein
MSQLSPELGFWVRAILAPRAFQRICKKIKAGGGVVSQIYNRSSHPVQVKRINIRVWSLRDEIEAAIHRRMQECEAAGIPLYIDDIKAFYGMRTDRPLAGQPQLKIVPAQESADLNDVMASVAATEPTPQDAAESKPLEETTPSGDTIQAADQIVDAQETAVKEQGPSEELKRPFERLAPDSDRISYGFALLNDINMDWMLTFSKQSFTPGQSLIIEFLIPHPFMMSAELVSCNNFAMRSRIISTTKPDYRLQCRFTFAQPGERLRLREFLRSVTPDLPPPRVKAPKKDDDTDVLP